MIAISSPSSHSFPASLTNPHRSCLTCPKVPTLQSTTVARAPVEPSPTCCKYVGHCTRSCGHHVTVVQPGIMEATSLAIHLVGRHGPWGVPTLVSCYSGFIYMIDVPLQAQGLVDPHPPSFPDRRVVICIPVACPWCRPPSPSCGQTP